MAKPVVQLDKVIIRFAGDSGDGMQLTGDRFTHETASFGNDLSTLPDFPAEIRAPAGTLPGVSAFQLHFADHAIQTPGDAADVLVAMNPAALKSNLHHVRRGGTLIVNSDEFTKRALDKVGYTVDPLSDGSLDSYAVTPVSLTTLTVGALKGFDITKKEAERAKNMFALGLLTWLYDRGVEGTKEFLETKFGRRPEILAANLAAFEAGWAYGETTEEFAVQYEVAPGAAAARPVPQHHREPRPVLRPDRRHPSSRACRCSWAPTPSRRPPTSSTSSAATRSSACARCSSRTRSPGSAPPSARRTAGLSAVTTTSGPGIALKSETIGLAVATELPLIVVDVQRGGPSTGLPTKTEQSDLLQALFGRNGEAPVPIVAPQSPSDCFDIAMEAARIATTYRTPVMLLSDGNIANGSEPWRVPAVEDLPDLRVSFATEPNHTLEDGTEVFWPFKRDPETLARPWAIPGTPGLEHRIGGIEKADGTGAISYDPDNHDRMVRLRQAKIDGIAATIPALEVDDPSGGARVLVLGWGSTHGPIAAACQMIRSEGGQVARAHLRHLNPFPANTGEILRAFDRVLIPEMNLGQLLMLIRAKYLVDAVGYNQVRGLPFKATELADQIRELL